ncbi:C4-dicarboxylate ABC transporter substrate-binding protein [Synergistales bacterium]|nr:C4-dicarboxylate ABC transporter substrate-binding protein [Synergistales bacterium]
MKRKFWIVALMLLCCAIFLAPEAGVAATPEYKWRMAQVHPEGSDYDQRAKDFARKVEERTNGRIHIDVFSNGILGDWTETFEMLSRGSLEVNMAQANSNFDPKLNLAYYFPYLVKDIEEAKQVYGKDGWAYKIIQDLWAEHNVKALAVIPLGMAGVSLKSKPASYANPEVHNLLKVRVMPIKPCELTYEAIGYVATPIPYAEAYSAIQTGIADGQMGGPPFQAWQFKDVNKVWIQYNDFFESWWIAVNLDLWNKLSPADQEIIQTAALEESAVQWERAAAEDEKYRQMLKDEYGWEIVILTPEELTKVADHVRKTVWPQMEGLLGKDLMDRVYRESGIPRP